MNLDWSKEENIFRDEVRTWLRENVPREKRPKEGVAMRDFDMGWQRKQYDGGWAGIAWPKEYGGRGLSVAQQLIWYEENAKADSPGVGIGFVGLNHGGPTLISQANEEQKSFHLPLILKGDAAWCQGFSEPGAGSDLAALSTRAEIDGADLVVNGSKIWTSYAHICEYQELLVRTEQGSQKHGGITWVICDMRLPGITIHPITLTNGHHHFNQVFYDDVRIPLANVVGEVNQGWKVAMATLSFERGTAFTQNQVELAQYIDTLIERAKSTIAPSGRPYFADDSIATRLAGLRAEVAALRAMTYATVSRNWRRDAPGPDGSILKILLARLRKEAQAVSITLMGADSLLLNDGTEDFLTSFAQTVAGGTDEIQKNIVAQRVLGLPRGY